VIQIPLHRRTNADEGLGLPEINTKSAGRKVHKIAGACAAVYAAIAGALFLVMLRPPDDFARIMKHVPWSAMAVLPFKPLGNAARGGHLASGEMAPDFSLESPDQMSRFQLSSLRGQSPLFSCSAVTRDRRSGGRLPRSTNCMSTRELAQPARQGLPFPSDVSKFGTRLELSLARQSIKSEGIA